MTCVTIRHLGHNPISVSIFVTIRQLILNLLVVPLVLTIRQLVLKPTVAPMFVTRFMATRHLVLITLLSSVAT